jgi:glycosyltransferase involved in cell wall biosynthesis
MRLHIPAARIKVIPRGRNPQRLGERTPSRRASVRDALGVTEDVPVILVASRQEPQKGIDILLQALPQLLQNDPRVTVLVAGREGRATPGYAPLLQDRNVNGAVRFLGERDDVPDLLAASDVFVLPSRREGLPGAVLEAMAVGIPIVASDLPPVREALPDLDYGYLVPPERPELLADALYAALRDHDESNRRSQNARRRFREHFDIATVSAAMATFYEETLAGR